MSQLRASVGDRQPVGVAEPAAQRGGGGAGPHQCGKGAMSGENYIPWEQIEPLLRPGMTYGELTCEVLGRLGLPVAKYRLSGRIMGGASDHDNMWINLRHGLYVDTAEEKARRI